MGDKQSGTSTPDGSTKTWNAVRVSKLVERLRERARPRLAAAVCQAWTDRQIKAGQPPSGLDWMRLGRLRHIAGDPARAAEAYRRAVQASNSSGRPDGLLIMGLGQLAACLDEAGLGESASQARELRDRVAKAYCEHPDAMRSIAPAHALVPAALICTSTMAIEWQSAAEVLSTIEEDGFAVLRDRIRLDENLETWTEFEAKAPADPECSYPHVELCTRFPWRFGGVRESKPVLELVNDMNLGNSAVSACLDPDSGQVAARCRVAFSGFNSGTSDELPDLRQIHVEITTNLMVELLNTLSVWLPRVAELAHQLGAEAVSQGGSPRA